MVVTTPARQTKTKVVLQGVQWTTFKLLMAESQEDFGYQIYYEPELLQISLSEASPALAEGTVIFQGISWQTYKALMQDVGDGRAWRIAYESGVLEIRMPLQKHEIPKILLANFVEAIADELEIETKQLGALTLEREDLVKAIEPDTCFYIQNEALVRSREDIKFPQDPPPDLAIESDNTNSSINKHSIYASLGVPELWRYRKKKLEIYQLVNGQYQLVDRSLAFPFLPVAEIPDFVERSKEVGQRSIVRLFRERIREILQG